MLEKKPLQEFSFDVIRLFCDVKTKRVRLGRTMRIQENKDKYVTKHGNGMLTLSRKTWGVFAQSPELEIKCEK